LKITILASGSDGNATLFDGGGTRLLVDAGLGPRVLARRIEAAGASGMPDAIVITHAHLDHAGHATRLARKLRVPLYVTEATARVTRLERAPDVRIYGTRDAFRVGGLVVTPTPLPHDVAQVALAISDGTRRAAIATDLGEVPPALPTLLAGCDVVLLESNHDRDMLERGPYPERLKRRIGSARGHLSNAQTHALLRALPPAAHTVVLMHLSRTNNRPDLALASAADALGSRGARLLAASQHEPLTVDAADAPPRFYRRPEQLALPL
jgi:phosphoribosyl 1,2-cyclic phosphodiesterase